ncbi:hypothetical protein F4861DRAFT_423616 [Xylaria intraflava]|nr:hypothetical protein F4861DRAFT_423616 [Xylaria intraflava]
MPPRLPVQLRPNRRQNSILKSYSHTGGQSTCFFCSLSLDLTQKRVTRRPKRVLSAHSRRFETASDHVQSNPRKELESVLLNLEKCAANYVNRSRLQLAVSGLRQKPGHESIRVAILGLTSGSTSASTTAKEVLKLLFADPLKDPEAWEQEVEVHDLTAPMIIRIGATDPEMETGISLTKESLLREIHISPANFGGCNIEILLADSDVLAPENGVVGSFADKVLVPTAEIPTLNNGRYNTITTPIHKALVVADGIHGAASVLSMPSLKSAGVLKYAVNFPEYKPTETASLPFTPIDTGAANIGLGLVRKNISNAIEYEHLWFQSNIPKLVEWLKADVITTSGEVTKPPVRDLITSLLEDTLASIQAEEARQLNFTPSPINKHTSLKPIEEGLSEWAESAHSELQEQLELAFSSKRWRRLGWWKLFWRVDDVGMLTSDILAQKFLPQAERSSIFLAGRMKEAGVSLSPQSNTTVITSDQNGNAVSRADLAKSPNQISWPMNIPNTRSYLQVETVPALQALAQKLVLQTLSTSGLMTALGGLVYIGTLTTTIYEAGAIAALGIVWSMKRMQRQWETARRFWEGEVREEGRKAVRGAEQAMASALVESNNPEHLPDTQDNLRMANNLVSRAKELLGQLR